MVEQRPKRKKRKDPPHRGADHRIQIDMPLVQKQQLSGIQAATGLSMMGLSRYGIQLVIDHFTAGTFDTRDALRHMRVAGRKRKE